MTKHKKIECIQMIDLKNIKDQNEEDNGYIVFMTESPKEVFEKETILDIIISLIKQLFS